MALGKNSINLWISCSFINQRKNSEINYNNSNQRIKRIMKKKLYILEKYHN